MNRTEPKTNPCKFLPSDNLSMKPEMFRSPNMFRYALWKASNTILLKVLKKIKLTSNPTIQQFVC